MSAATTPKNTTVQPALFDMNVTAEYTEADRVADRKICWSYTKQWARGFKKAGVGQAASGERTAGTEITTEEFEAAAARLAQ